MSSTIHLSGAIRSRKLDFRKPLTVCRSSTLPDLDENASLNRITSTVSTGVEKEEEDEHHLQVALTNGQHIPTPDASVIIDDYQLFYSADWQQSTSYIVWSGEGVCSGYNADILDMDWCEKRKIDVSALEVIFGGLERLAGEKIDGVLPGLEEFKEFISIELPELLQSSNIFEPVYEWWLYRKNKRNNLPMTPQLKFSEPDGIEYDSYVCFRKRDPRTIRKTRRCDTASLDKLRKLRDEMKHARDLLYMAAERERTRREILIIQKQVFEARIKVRRIKHILGIATGAGDVDNSPEKSIRSRGGTRIKIPLGRIKESLVGGVEGASVSDRIKRRKLLDENEGWFEFAEAPFQQQAEPNFWTELPVSSTQPFLPRTFDDIIEPVLYRRRRGRGGRIIFDRHTPQPTHPRWKWDTNSPSINLIQDSARFAAYRAFNLAPASEQECRSLMNKPYFPDAINVVPLNHAQRSVLAAQIAEKSASPQVKKKRTVVDTKPVKKKIVETLNPREQAVRKLLHDSQVQAAQNAQNTPRPAMAQALASPKNGIPAPQPRFFLPPNHRLAPGSREQVLQQQQYFRKIQSESGGSGSK